MARRSSGSGFGIALLVIIGLVASFPRAVWIAIAVAIVVGFVLHAFMKSTPQSPAPASPEPSRFAPRPALVRQDVDPAVTSATCWIPPDKSTDIKGVGSVGGMLYVGKGLARISGQGIEPALINPRLPVKLSNEPAEQLPYWPSYSEVSPRARGGYLQWLADGRKDPNVQTGYVFLFFYGLERRALVDAGQDDQAKAELPYILAELRRLLSIYGANGSFYGYATRLADLVVTLGAKDRIYRLPPPAPGRHKALTVRHKIALGQAAIDGAALSPDWAYCWLMNDERFYPRTPARRAPDEFKALFLDGYKNAFGDGLKLPVNKTKLRTLYKPASASFGYGHVELEDSDLPDVTVLEGPFNRLKEVAERASTVLAPFSRYVGKNSEKRDARLAQLLLPVSAWPADRAQALTSQLAELGAQSNVKATTLRELLKTLPAGEPLRKDGYVALGAALEGIGVGIEPDVRWGGTLPAEEDSIVVFPLAEAAVDAKPSAHYAAAALAVHLAVAVTAADGVISDEEKTYLHSQLDKWPHLAPAERARLYAHLQRLIIEPPALTALKKRVSSLLSAQKSAIAEFLVSVAQLDGETTPGELKTLTKIYRLLGLDEKLLYNRVHAAATDVVTVQPAKPDSRSFAIPRKPTALNLDAERIAALKADSERVSELLAGIFVEEAPAEEPVAATEPEPADTSILGLNATDSDLARVLVSRDRWTRAELEDLASDRGIMLDGALERINEAALDVHGESLLEGDELVEVNRDVAKELEAA